MSIRIIGRSSSHFTRVLRIFAHELEVPYSFVPVYDLLSCSPSDYAGNPALRLPALATPQGDYYGALNGCRALSRIAPRRVVWPEQLVDPVLCNAQELVLQAMATEVNVIMLRKTAATDDAYQIKSRRALDNCLRWLDQRAPTLSDQLPADRELSFLEVTLFCLITHLQFRELAHLDGLPGLRRFAASFGERPSARATCYSFDAPPQP